jgi:hypothetical protein
MYHYTECPQRGWDALLSTEPERRDAKAYSGRCLHCGTEFTFHPVEPVTPSSANEKE